MINAGKGVFNAVMKKGTHVGSNVGLGNRLLAEVGGADNIAQMGVLRANRKTAIKSQQSIKSGFDSQIAEKNKQLSNSLLDESDKAGIMKMRDELQSQSLAAQKDAMKGYGKRDMAKGYGKEAWGFMRAGTAGQQAVKFGAAGAAYMGVNAVGRAVTGGGATYNSSGQRDIMGVPLI